MPTSRRNFLSQSAAFGSGILLLPYGLSSCASPAGGKETPSESPDARSVGETTADLFFKISLAQWSLHKTLFDGEMDNLDFAAKAKSEFGIEAVEYVNQFFKDKAKDSDYLGQMKQRAADAGVASLIIMVDGEGGLGNPNEAERTKAVENHYKWVEAAQFLGCHSIRVNAYGEGSAADVSSAAIDGLGKLSTFAKDFDLNVIVENHGGYSSNGEWMANVISQVSMDNCGMLPDFGNFCITRGDDGCAEEYDRYKGVELFMPTAKAVSAKSHDFDEAGNEIHTDYRRMLQIVKDAGYRGYIGVEYEGRKLGEAEGIKATKALLEKVGAELS